MESKIITGTSSSIGNLDKLSSEYNNTFVYLAKLKHEYKQKKDEFELLRNSLNSFSSISIIFIYFIILNILATNLKLKPSGETQYDLKKAIIGFIICIVIGFLLSKPRQ